MDLRIQPKPDVNFLPANRGMVSRKQFFVKKNFEEINQYFFPALFIRHWKPKADLLYPPVSDVSAIQYECDFNRDVQSCFVEDYAEEIFLRTPPPCFVVFGKSGSSVIELSKQIASDYGSVLIHVDDIVERVIQTETETAKTLDRILRLGLPLTLNFILALLSYMAHTPEARHRGYVLCGLPSPAFSQDMPVDQQFHYLFTWDNKPTFFVNVLFEDEDLIKERTNLRYEIKDLGKGSSIIPHLVHDDAVDDNVDEEIVDETTPVKEKETSYEPDIDISPSRPWVQLPRDEEPRVWSELESFDIVIRPAIELIHSRVDPQYFVTVDSRLNNEYEIVKARLNLLQIWKVPEAVPFMSLNEEKTKGESEAEEKETDEEVEESSEKEGSNDSEDFRRVAEEPPQTSFLTLFKKKTLSPKYRWELSHYNYICPVSLRGGEVVEGKSKYAVYFMKYIYFLHDRDCVIKFMKNPRAYVLPIRPRPLCRFFILGYPFSGKTTLARTLAWEFSIPLINVDDVLRKDAERKKNSYQEFCRQSAECRELIRLTALAWQDWRKEEEERINLIEQWVVYLQGILQERINQFYSSVRVRGSSVKSGTFTESFENFRSGAQSVSASISTATSRATSEGKRSKRKRTSSRPHFTPSAELIEAIKERRSDFSKDEANSYFSYMWKTFTGRPKKHYKKDTPSTEYYGEGSPEEGDSEDDEEGITVNWCDLLPPQSLSSLLITKLPCTTKIKRESFKFFLEAASKAYHEPSKLKSEFAKWHLPCYMDIPLCEIFLENPMILLKYVPVWLRERPLIPDPVDPTHPSVVAAGESAFQRASVVVVRQSPEEQGILLRNAIEKAEREGMRVTGEVITPGGWVVDNMTLDPAVWKKLICDHVFADHVYFLTDSELGHRRIINTWWDLFGKYFYSKTSLLGEIEGEMETLTEFSTAQDSTEEESRDSSMYRTSVVSLLAEWVAVNEKGEKNLDEIFDRLNAQVIKYFFPPVPVDTFCHHMFENTVENWNDLREESLNEDSLYLIQMITGLVSKTFFWNREVTASVARIPLGTRLEICEQDVLDFFKKKISGEEKKEDIARDLSERLEFFKNLVTLPGKLKQLKELFKQTDRSETIEEVEVSGKTPEAVFKDIRKKLMSPFMKKPRELEEFEIEEIKLSSRRDSDQLNEEEEEEEEEEEYKESFEAGRKESSEEEDVRIFGESGQLCIVNLERNKYLRGKLDFCLRYWGKLYYFWDQDAKEKFIENPEKYAPYYSAIRCYPPLRIYMVGPTGSGRTTFSVPIARHCNLAPIDYIKFLRKCLVPYSDPVGEKYVVIDKYSLLLSENLNEPAKKLKDQFMRIPYGRRQFWMEQSFHTSAEDNKEIYDFLSKISVDPSPPVQFPELHYRCVESVYETYGDDYEDLLPIVSDYSEVPFMSMKELESTVQEYLQSNTDLSALCRDKSIKTLWEQDPYVKVGFILEGFPMRALDLKHIIDNAWIPDMVFEIILGESVIIERNMDMLMNMWEAKLKKETAEHESLELALTTIQSNCRAIREKELTVEKQKQILRLAGMQRESFDTSSVFSKDFTGKGRARKRRLTQEFYWNTDEELNVKLPPDVKAEIEQTLDEEYPTLIFKPTFESYNTGKERISNHLHKTCKRDVAEIEKIKSMLADLDIPWIELDGMKPKNEIINNLLIKLDKVRSRAMHKGEFAFTMAMETAEKLLEQGYYFLSKFGRLCPVQVYRKTNPIHMFRPLKAKGKITPIAYRNYIYFIGGENEKSKFLEDPLKYIFNEPHHPIIPLRVAVIGPPKSGKTTLSKRLGAMFDMKVVTMGYALRFALEKIPESTLAKSIDGYLRRGCLLPLSLKVEALMVCLNDPSCVTQGFVFDGIPFDAALTQSLAERGKLPFVIISLLADSHFGKTNRENLNLKEYRLPYKQRVNMDTRYRDWLDTYKRFSNWNRNTYNNLYEINSKLSVVDIFYKAFDIIKKSFFGILYYYENCVSDKALPLRYLCVGNQEFQSKKSAFGSNCPVCWVEVKRLKISLDSSSKSGLYQYQNHMYWICPRHEEKFAKNPKAYLPPVIPKWPEMLPERFVQTLEDKASVQLRVHGYGRCPVTRVDFPSILEWEGSWDFAASYAGEIFLCKNEKMLERFLAQPWRYYRADTKFEVERPQKSNAVINLGPPKLTSLPPIGFLEQTVANLLHEALQMAGSLRPVYPNIHPRVTGCVFVALYLKVHNINKKGSFLDVQCFEFFIRHCKATKFKVTDFRPPEDGSSGHGDMEPDFSQPSSSSSDEISRPELFERNWLDFETQASRRMWSAKHLSQKKTEMKMTENDELVEIPEIPATIAILKYQTYSLRPSPLPPIDDCLNFIYSIPPRVQVPEKFNYNSLYQTSLTFSYPFTPQIMFNPQKQFSQSLFHRKEPSFPSSINLHDEKRVLSDISMTENKPKILGEPNAELMKKGFFPRFQMLDKFTPAPVPPAPQVYEKEPLILNPHHEYTHMLLLSELFKNTHHIKSFQLDERHRHLEYLNRLDRKLDPNTTQADYIFRPKITPSMRTSTSLNSYQQIFDVVTPFLITDTSRRVTIAPVEDEKEKEEVEGQDEEIQEDENEATREISNPGFANYLETLLEKVDDPQRVSSHMSCDSFEVNVVPKNSDTSQKSEVMIHEILPYPPLTWDIISRPYYAYCSIPAIFEKPHLDDIAHERHVSLLDGITELHEEYRFVPYPTNVQVKFEASARSKRRKNASPCHFYFDFFNIPWTSFLTYPYKWASTSGNMEALGDKDDTVEPSWVTHRM